MYCLSLGMCQGWGGGKGIHYCPVSGTDCVILMVCWESCERTSKLCFTPSQPVQLYQGNSERTKVCCGCEDFLNRTSE